MYRTKGASAKRLNVLQLCADSARKNRQAGAEDVPTRRDNRVKQLGRTQRLRYTDMNIVVVRSGLLQTKTVYQLVHRRVKFSTSYASGA